MSIHLNRLYGKILGALHDEAPNLQREMRDMVGRPHPTTVRWTLHRWTSHGTQYTAELVLKNYEGEEP